MGCVFILQWREKLGLTIKNMGNLAMKAEDKKMVERIMSTGTMAECQTL